jgi:hypothetical protein
MGFLFENWIYPHTRNDLLHLLGEKTGFFFTIRGDKHLLETYNASPSGLPRVLFDCKVMGNIHQILAQ